MLCKQDGVEEGDMRSWFQKPRGAKSKVPKTLFGIDLKPKIIYVLVLL